MLEQIKSIFSGKAPIQIGVVTTRIGPLASFGAQQINGLELGIEYATQGSGHVDGHAINILIEDDNGEPATGEQKARQLVEKRGVHILQGCASSEIATLIARVAEQHKRLFLIEPAAADSLTREDFNRYIFRTASSVSQDAAAGGKYAVEKLGKTFYFIAPDYIWGRQSIAAWKRVVRAYGGEILGEIYAPLNETDFMPHLRRIVAAKPQVLVQSWAGSRSFDLVNQMRMTGVFEKMKVTGSLDDRSARHALRESAVGMIALLKYSHVLPQNPVNNWLVQRHQEKFGEPPDLFTGGGFAAGVALVEALKRTGGDPDPEALIPVMEGMSFAGPKGTYTFRPEDHQALQPMYIVEMVKHPDQSYCIPELIEEVSAQDSAPPLYQAR